MAVRFAKLKEYRSRAKWPTVFMSGLLVILNAVIESTYIDYSQGMSDRTPDVFRKIYALSFLLTLLLGIFTLLRWYSIPALRGDCVGNLHFRGKIERNCCQ